MANRSLVIIGLFLILSAVPTNSIQFACVSNATIQCSWANLYYMPPDASGLSLMEVLGWVLKSVTITQVGVQIYDTNNHILHDWQLSSVYTVYTITSQAEQFFYAPWFSTLGLPSGNYDASFGMFDQNGILIYELPFNFIL